MLSTKNLVNNYTDVPESWIFENYCDIGEKLTGQEVMIKSIFNPQDSAPSMSFYVDKKTLKYKFKDFSSGKGGNPINLVMEIKNMDFSNAARLIVNDYNTYKLTHKHEELTFKQQAKYQVTDNTVRQWNTNDQSFWTDFYIGTTFLNEYLIKPLADYTLSKNEEDGTVKQITIKGEYIYGYFKKSGELYKIYQPKNKERKYIKISPYIQGSEQLQGHQVLIIQSGIKDIGAMYSLELQVDKIAPDSENVMLPPTEMKSYLKRYKYIFVMFDNDEAGIKAMKKYKETYNIPCILLTTAKDLAESVKYKGPKEIRQRVVSLIELKTFHS